MKVTLLVPAFDYSGGVRVLAQYAEGLRQRGHDVFAVGNPRRLPRFRGRVKVLLKTGSWPRYPRTPPPSHFDSTRVECRILDRNRPVVDADLPDADVVVATWWETAPWVAALAPRKGAKVYFVQGHEADPAFCGPDRVDRVAATYALPLHKIVISPWLARIMRENYGDPDTSLVPNSIALDRFHTPPRGKQARPTVGWIHAHESLKCSDVALEAAAILRERFPDLHVSCFGNQPPPASMPLPAGSSYHLKPPQDQIPGHYAACDAWLIASRTEGFGLPLVEAMACRTPVVSTPVGIAETYVRDGENGFLVPIGDARAMADAASEILRWGEARWRAASEAARKTVDSYTLDEAIDRFEAALAEAVRRGREAGVPLAADGGRP